MYHLHVTPLLSLGKKTGGTLSLAEKLSIMGILKQLSDKGRTFESDPVWAMNGEAGVVDLSKETSVELVELKYGHALKEGDYYILLKRGVSSSKTTYRVATFVATRDWTSDNGDATIAEGEERSFAF